MGRNPQSNQNGCLGFIIFFTLLGLMVFLTIKINTGA